MKGLALAERYFEACGRPMLEEEFPELAPRVAAGLVGQGSECFGFDDAISRDHDFGPGFCLWLTDEDAERYGQALAKAYEALPKDFLGVPGRLASAQGGGRVGVMTIRHFYQRFIGSEQPPRSNRRWLLLPSHQLATATNGQIFCDPLGEFSALRAALAAYPEDVRRKKIAAHLALMAQSGQYNYARSMRRGETVAAELALREFIEKTLGLVYLLNHRYAPYYKWLFHGAQTLPVLAPAVCPMLAALCENGVQRDAWTGAVTDPQVNRRDQKVVLIEAICAEVVKELKRQQLTGLDVDFLEPHAWEVQACIGDPQLRRCHIMEGA